jgi:predicted alpha/beta hydrolase
MGGGTGRPGIVLVPGSGEGVPREVYQPHAEAFARAGIVALVYDKRTAAEGYSLFEASITDLADDAIAGVRLLQDRHDVNPNLVGLHGHSEGGWTVTVAGGRSSDVAFVVASAASALPPERTQVWMNRTQLRHAGVAESLLRPLGENLTRHVVGAGMFRLAGHDPIRPLEQLDQPVLGVFAEYDRSAPPGESLRLFQQSLDRVGYTH